MRAFSDENCGLSGSVRKCRREGSASRQDDLSQSLMDNNATDKYNSKIDEGKSECILYTNMD
jgi:hypothetical protein